MKDPTIGIPNGLATMSPGPELAVILESLDPSLLSGHDRLTVTRAWNRQLAHVQARFAEAIVAVAEATPRYWAGVDDLDLGEKLDCGASELRPALTWTRRRAEAQLGFAYDLTQRLPQVFRQLQDGNIDVAKARVICDQTIHLDEPAARRVADSALQQAPGQTTGQLRAHIQRLIISIDPESARQRYERGLEDRRVVLEADDDGTAQLHGLGLPAEQANRAFDRINRLARQAKTADDPRSVDQVRADVYLDLLTGAADPSGQRRNQGVVDLRVDITTLIGLDEQPGEIPGWGPIITDTARRIAARHEDSEWRVTVTDETGRVIDTRATRRRPNAQQQREIQARNPTCIFPGCRMPAPHTDIDHHQPRSEQGPTTDSNLGPLWRHDHVIKHRGPWKIDQIRPGRYQITSPLGHTYTTGPDPP